ncbi:MAG: CTP synthase [Rickettsiales bacterium]|nr:CTP synthase [Rickettsiales bacterium]
MTRFVFITGGVVSSIGKGLSSASLAVLLQARGYKVCLRKLDPYLNVDPGTMNPTQHGEVFVTDDGSETDLDLGHYERFTGIESTKFDNVTTGKIYSTLLQKERKGEYLGATVQVIPHVTNLIKDFVYTNTKQYDFVLCEIGGTVGDIEALPFFESARQIWNESRNMVRFIHVTLLPYIATSRELKTKPTQHSVKELRAIGIQPDILLCRASKEIPDKEKEKIALFCNVDQKNVISALDVKNLYEAPIKYHHEGIDTRLLESFGIDCSSTKLDLTAWDKIVNKIDSASEEVTIAIVGKYKLYDAYISVVESIKHAAIFAGVQVNIKLVLSRGLKEDNIQEKLSGVDAVIVPGGFGTDGIDGKIQTISYVREKHIPFLGICLGMQLSVIEFARNVVGIKDASSSEFDDTKNPVIGLLTEWSKETIVEKRDKDTDLGGTMRLGAYDTYLENGTLIKSLYGSEKISERHRHRYEFNSKYQDILSKHGMIFSGVSHDRKLLETIEIKGHPWFVGVQFHPEFKSRPFKPHPLFKGLVDAAIKYKRSRAQ